MLDKVLMDRRGAGQVARGSAKNTGGTRNRRSGANGGKSGDTTAPTPSVVDTLADATVDSAAPTAADPAFVPQDIQPPAEIAESVAAKDAAMDAGLAGDDGIAPDAAPPHEDTPEGHAAAVEEAEFIEPRAPEPPHVPAPPPEQVAERRSGFVPLLLGGVLAAGIGYGAAYMGWLPTADTGDDANTAALTAALEQQNETLGALQAQVADLAEAEPPAPVAPEVDFSPVLDEIAGLSARIDGATAEIAALADRVVLLEERPVFSGDVEGDAAAALEAAAVLEAELTAQREAAARRAAELEAEAAAAAAAAQAAIQQAATEAEAAIAAAEAEAAAAEAQAAAATARAAAEAALGQVQIALETGQPYAEALATVAATAGVPEGLTAAADSGVVTLDALQSRFPALAREALPIALQETAGEGVGDRLGAFVMGQIGGRSVEPREGSDPDAVLSRVEAAVRAGDLDAALTEIAALPDGARSVLAPWVADVEARAAAVEGLATLTASVAATGN